MNPMLADSSLLLHLRHLIQQPARPEVDWRARVARHLTQCGAHSEWIDEVTRLLGAIFLYSPQRRLSSQELAQHPFWSADMRLPVRPSGAF